MTFAPERPGAAGFPALLGSHNILAAIGHTDCDAETASGALRAGLDAASRGGRPLVTHVFNGMAPLHHRAPGPVSAARLAAGNSIAGGVATMLDVVRWRVQSAGVPLLDAVTAASSTPSQTLALAGIGRLQAGHAADVVVVDDDLALQAVMRRGVWLSGGT